MTTIDEQIQQQVNQHDVVLYMKGTCRLPQCGFSALVAGIMERLDVEVHDVNILMDQELRQGIKEFSDWPTIPQLYIKGEFVGGSDIVREMYEAGELQTMLKDKGVSFKEQAA